MQRLSASLRDNLKRRKTQARGRRVERSASADDARTIPTIPPDLPTKN
jgi:hypothetical protein